MNTSILKTITESKPKWKRKTHSNIIIIGHKDSGKSATPRHLVCKLVGWTNEPSKNLRRSLLRWESALSSMSGSWINCKLTLNILSPLIPPFGNSRPASILWLSRCPRTQRLYRKHNYRHIPCPLCYPNCCYLCWWIWSRHFQEWADPLACPFGVHHGCETTNHWRWQNEFHWAALQPGEIQGNR